MCVCVRVCVCVLSAELCHRLCLVVLIVCSTPNRIETRCSVSVFFSDLSVLFNSVLFCPISVCVEATIGTFEVA